MTAKPILRLALAAAVLLPAFHLGATENWPGWRGPRADGTVEDGPLPTGWKSAEEFAWKTAIPGKGHASPVIWGDRIFVVSAVVETQERVLVCLDRPTGKILWQRTVLTSPMEGLHRLNSHASSTPVTDGKRVFVSFLDETEMFAAAYDFEGNKLWETRPGGFSSKHGFCSCPVLWNGKVIINGDHDGKGYLVALSESTGETIWKVDRPHNTRSYCTPIIREIGGRTQMVLSGSKCVASYDPDTGERHWIIEGPTEQYVASLVYDGEFMFMTCGFPEKHILAIRPDGSGDVTKSHVAWHETVGASYVPSPILAGGYLFVVADNGALSCIQPKTGERVWRDRLPGDHNPSPIVANGLVYFTSNTGILSVVKPGPVLDIVAQSELGEPVSASPAVFGGQLFIRGDQHLYCIGGAN